jgi:hypothetical protein
MIEHLPKKKSPTIHTVHNDERINAGNKVKMSTFSIPIQYHAKSKVVGGITRQEKEVWHLD